MNGPGRLVGQLQSRDAALTQSLLRVVCYMANGGTALTEMYNVGPSDMRVHLYCVVCYCLCAQAHMLCWWRRTT